MTGSALESELRDNIEQAARFLEGKIRRTPVERSPELERILGVPVWLKLESLQLTGSFKIRGAWFRLSRLTAAEREAGVLTCSAGNHGKAVAYAARALELRPVICVPASVDPAKYHGMLALGAEVRVSTFQGYDDTEVWARELADKEGRIFVSPFDDIAVMAGNGGTVAAEILDEAPACGTFVLPVGGGGLAAGLAFHVKERRPKAIITGCQHELSPGLKLSLDAGQAITRLPAIDTVAGGVEGGLGRLPFEILRTRVDRVALVSEQEILSATRWMMEHHQYMIEPSSAVVIAACLYGKAGQFHSPAAVVVSGRNAGIETMRRILCTHS